jgi:hypothetical protein
MDVRSVWSGADVIHGANMSDAVALLVSPEMSTHATELVVCPRHSFEVDSITEQSLLSVLPVAAHFGGDVRRPRAARHRARPASQSTDYVPKAPSVRDATMAFLVRQDTDRCRKTDP